MIRQMKYGIVVLMLVLLLAGSAGAASVNDSIDQIFMKIKDAANNASLVHSPIFKSFEQSYDKTKITVQQESQTKEDRQLNKVQNQEENIPVPPLHLQNKESVKNSLGISSNKVVQDQTENKDVLYLNNGYAIRIIAVDQEASPHKLWLALEKDGIKLDDKILDSGDEYSYKNNDDAVKLKVEVFANGRASIVLLRNLYQFSKAEIILNNESFTLTPSFSFSPDVQSPTDSLIPEGKSIVSTASDIPKTITVDDDGIADYTNIQQAIDVANSGDTIFVKNGTYYEHLFILKKNLTIIGENKEKTIINGGGEGGIVNLYGANNNTIQNITVQNGKIESTSFPDIWGNRSVFLKENYSLMVQAIDTKSRQVWFVLSKNETKLDDVVLAEGETYNYIMKYNPYVNKSDTLILSLTMYNVFVHTPIEYMILKSITQYSEKNLSVILQNENVVYAPGGPEGFILETGGIEWELNENYTLSVLDVDVTASPNRKAMMLLSKNGMAIEYKILNASERYSYYKDNKLILRADIEAVFGGTGVYLVKLSNVYQYSEFSPTLLLSNAMHLYTVGTPRLVEWQLFQNYSLSAMDVDSKALPRQVWLRLNRGNVTVEDRIIQTGGNFTFYRNSTKILNLSVDAIFDGRSADVAFVSKVYQYSETDGNTILMQNESHNFIFGGSAGVDWQLYDNYTIAFMDADIKTAPAQAWLRMKKNGIPVDDKVVAENQTYSYTNPSGRLIFNGKIDKIFSGNLDFLKIINAYQFSELDGTPLIVNATHSFYPRNLEFLESLSEKFVLYENYTIIPIDISGKTNPRRLWMRLYKSNVMVDEKILEPGQIYSYYSGGREIIKTKVDSIFAGATSDMVQFRDFYQYSEVDGTLLMYMQKRTLIVGARALSNKFAGVSLDRSNGNKLRDIKILNNYYGIYLKNSSFNNISNNNIINNTDFRIYGYADAGGILLSDSSTNNSLHANNLTNNSNGVYIKYTYTYVNGSYVGTPSIDNGIYHNSFVNNTRNGYDAYSVNRWDNGYFEGGNYWSDYTGVDEDGDGVGDTPYYVNGGRDNFPLMAPWNGAIRVPKTIYVDDNFTDDPLNHKWNTIQKGINDAKTGDTILAYNGTYYENIEINKKMLTLKGIGYPAVNPSSWYAIYINYTASGTTVDGFVITNPVSYGGAGIYIRSDDNVIKNNIISNSWQGIVMYSTYNNTLINNSLIGNRYGLGVYWGYYHNIDASNKIEGKPVLYLVNAENRLIDTSSNPGYLGIVNSRNITVRGISMKNNSQGILLAYSYDSRIENVVVTDNREGIHIAGSRNIITNNNASNNDIGIYLWGAYNNSISNNILISNSYGIDMDYSTGNNIGWNSISGNYMGVSLWLSYDNALTHNTINTADYDYGIRVYGWEKQHYRNSIDSTNRLNGKPVYYYYNVNNSVISGLLTSHLTVAASDNVTIRNNNVSGGDGIRLAYVSNSTISDNIVSNNTIGIGIDWNSNNNTMISNNISYNKQDSIEVNGNSNKISSNIVSNDGAVDVSGQANVLFNNKISYSRGIYAGGSNNSILGNNISNNDWTGIEARGFNNSISGNRVSESYNGIYVGWDSFSNILKDNIITNNTYGLQIYSQAYNNSYFNNTISKNMYGLQLQSSNTTLSNINISDNKYGLTLSYSYNNTLRNININNNSYNFNIQGWELGHYIHDIDPSNKINGKPIYYLVNQTGSVISQDAGFIGLINSRNIILKNLTSNGILFAYINHSKIENVSVYNSSGIVLKFSNNNSITDSKAANNSYGIELYGSSNTIKDNIISNNEGGISIDWSGNGNNTVVNNTVLNNGFAILLGGDNNNISSNKALNNTFGILLGYSNNNTMSKNNASNNELGIFLWYSGNNTLKNNSMINNTQGFGVFSGYLLQFFLNDIDSSNTINNKPIQYIINGNNLIIEANAGYVGLINSSNIIVRNIEPESILLAYTNDSIIENARILSNRISFLFDASIFNGLFIHSSFNNTVKNSSVSNKIIGMALSRSDNNTLIENSVYDNLVGIYLADESKYNQMYHNNLINNTYQNQKYNAIIEGGGNNAWDNGYPTGGNYWNDYDGVDNFSGHSQNIPGRDGIGDTPYNISGGAGAQDRYPFMRVNGWLGDVQPPASVTALHVYSVATTWINWTWTDPIDADFSHVIVYIDEVFRTNVYKGIQFYNATGFSPNTTHTISTRTVDITGNVNQTWLNHTARTSPAAPSDILSYYRSLGSNPNAVETTDLLRAADDWSRDIAPPGFTVPITTVQLLALADEWSRS